MCGMALPHLSSHKPEVPWVIVTIIGLSYVHNPGCVTVEDNKKINALSTGLARRIALLFTKKLTTS